MTPAKLKDSYTNLPEREQRALRILALVVLIAVLAQTIWSAHEASSRLRRQLPQLENKLALTRLAEKAVQENRAKPPVRIYEGDALLRQSRELAKSRLTGLEPSALNLDGAREISFQAVVSFNAWVEFAAAVHHELALRLVSCELVPSGAGRVQVKARFALADPVS